MPEMERNHLVEPVKTKGGETIWLPLIKEAIPNDGVFYDPYTGKTEEDPEERIGTMGKYTVSALEEIAKANGVNW